MRSSIEFSDLDGQCNPIVVKGGHDYILHSYYKHNYKKNLSSNWALIFIFNIKWYEFKYPYSLSNEQIA